MAGTQRDRLGKVDHTSEVGLVAAGPEIVARLDRDACICVARKMGMIEIRRVVK